MVVVMVVRVVAIAVVVVDMVVALGDAWWVAVQVGELVSFDLVVVVAFVVVVVVVFCAALLLAIDAAPAIVVARDRSAALEGAAGFAGLVIVLVDLDVVDAVVEADGNAPIAVTENKSAAVVAGVDRVARE